MELFKSRKFLIIKGQFFRINTTSCLCGDSRSYCQEKCKSLFEKFLSPPPPPPPAELTHHSHKVSTFLTGTITLFAVSFFLICAYALYSKYLSNRSRRANPNNPSPNPNPNPNDDDEEEDRGAVEHHVWYIRTVGIDPAAIASITAVKYKKGDNLVESTDCSVCLSEFEEDEALRLLPKCRHTFHVACIDTWLRSHTNCPMCRAPVVILSPEEEPKPPEVAAPENDAGGESGVDETVVRVAEPSRRSVSLGCLDDKELEIINKLRGHNSNSNSNNRIGKRLQRMRSGNLSSTSSSSSSSSSSMKRSSSCNGKFVLCRPIRVTDSILPLRSV